MTVNVVVFVSCRNTKPVVHEGKGSGLWWMGHSIAERLMINDGALARME